MTYTRRTMLIASTLLCGVSLAQVQGIPDDIEMGISISLQEKITKLAHSVYDKYEGNTAENQRAIVEELTPLVDKLKASGQIEEYLIVCDATNNPPGIVNTGFILLFVLWTAGPSNEGVLNRVIIGPEDAVNHLGMATHGSTLMM